MKLYSVFLTSLVLVSAPAFSQSVEGVCQVFNSTGSAEITIHDSGGHIAGATGTSNILSVTPSSTGWLQRIEIAYTSQLAATEGGTDPVKVTLILAPSPVTALAGVNFVGVLATAVGVPVFSVPGPFEMAPGGWNNPFPWLIPSMIPAGYVAFATASCDLTLNQ